MQRYTISFITVNVLHVSCGFSAHHQELKNCPHSIGYMSSLLTATASSSSKHINKNKIKNQISTKSVLQFQSQNVRMGWTSVLCINLSQFYTHTE